MTQFRSNVDPETLRVFSDRLGGSWSAADVFHYVYGLLHSLEYRGRFAEDLKRELPRIPLVANARQFVEAGQSLIDLHLSYETVEPYALEGLDVEPPNGINAQEFYRVEKMRFPRKGFREAIVYNSNITLSGIPEGAYRYQLGSRSAIEWLMDRYRITKDSKSGILNDPNDWSREVSDPRYILDLVARIVTVSVETMRIVDALPDLDILEDQAQ